MPQRRLKPIDVVLAIVGILVIVAGLAMISPEVRDYLAKMFSGDSTDVTLFATRAQNYGREMYRSVNQYRANNVPMVSFGVVAVVLAFLMFRT